MLNDWTIRLRALFKRDSVEHELDDEIHFHLDQEAEKLIAQGLPRREAERQARLALGGVVQIKEDCREARGVAALEVLVRDVGHGFRTIRRSPTFAATTILTVTLAIAALATIMTLGNTLFLRGLPIADGDRAIAVYAIRNGRPGSEGLVSYPDYLSFRNARTIEGLAAHYPTAPLFASAGANARELNGAVVSANYFSLLGSTPAFGRYFRADEDAVPDRDRVAVLAYTLWRDWFAASPAAVGSDIRINGVPFTIVGVAPSTLPALNPQPPEIYLPTMALRVGYRWCDDALAPDCTILGMIGRLAPGRSIDEARAELSTLLPPAWSRARIGDNMAIAAKRPRGTSSSASERRLVEVLGGVAVILLLVCCANLTGLLTAQAAARASEFATRAAIGAGPGRIVRQFMTESMVLAAIGGALSLVAARAFVFAISGRFYSIDQEGHPSALTSICRGRLRWQPSSWRWPAARSSVRSRPFEWRESPRSGISGGGRA